MTQQVANTILAQLGGNRFIAMTGAKSFVGSPDSLMFAIPRAKKGITKIRIKLAKDDTYTVSFFKIAKFNVDTIAEVEGIYFDQLQSVFTNHTGLETHL